VRPFTAIVRDGSLAETSPFRGRIERLLIGGVVWQALACVLLVAALLEPSRRVRRALRLSQYVPPQVLLENKCAMQLVADGRALDDGVRGNFADAEALLAAMTLGVALVDRKLALLGANPALARMLGVERLRGLGELLVDSD
jgi:PAS domain-containing protein